MQLWLAAFFCLLSGAALAQEFTTLKGHGGPIMGIAVAPDGQVVTASFDNSVGLWDGPAADWLEGHDAAVTALTIGAAGHVISGSDDFTVRVWTSPGRVLGRHAGKVTSLDATERLVASGSWDGSVRLWSLEGDPPRVLGTPGGGVNAVVFTETGDGLYAATTDGVLLRYDVATGDALPLVKHGFGVNQIVLGSGWIAYGAVDGGTRVIDRVNGAEIADFTLDRRPILAMAWHAGTQQLAVGDGQGYIMMIDTATWQITRDFRAARHGPVWALAFSPDGQTIYAGGLDDVAYAWPVALLSEFDPGISGARSFLQDVAAMPNGERQFMRKCSICHALEQGPSRKAGPTLFGVFGRQAGTVPDYPYSQTLAGSPIVWDDTTIDALFDQGPDHYIPGSKMPMQVIAKAGDRADLIAFLKQATKE